MKDELKSMAQNGVWDLVELPEGCKSVGEDEHMPEIEAMRGMGNKV